MCGRLRGPGADGVRRELAPVASRGLEVLDDAVSGVATAFGVPGQDARWTDYSPAAIDARGAYLRETLDRLAASIARACRTPDQLNYDLYGPARDGGRRASRSTTTRFPFRRDSAQPAMPINQLEGVQQDIPRTIALMPTATVDDYENIVSRLQRRAGRSSIRRSR